MRWFARLAALLLSLMAGGRVLADPRAVDDPGAIRLALGLAAGRYPGTPPSSSSARGPSYNNAGSVGAVFLRGERRMADWWSLAVSAELGNWWVSAAADAGYDVQRLDLGLAPHVIPVRFKSSGRITKEYFLTMPVGATRPFVSVPGRRAFDERVDERWGWYLGAGVGAAFIGDHWGAQFEVGYVRHWSGARSTFTPHDPAVPASIEDVTYNDQEIFFNGAVLFEF